MQNKRLRTIIIDSEMKCYQQFNTLGQHPRYQSINHLCRKSSLGGTTRGKIHESVETFVNRNAILRGKLHTFWWFHSHLFHSAEWEHHHYLSLWTWSEAVKYFSLKWRSILSLFIYRSSKIYILWMVKTCKKDLLWLMSSVVRCVWVYVAFLIRWKSYFNELYQPTSVVIN